MASVSFNELKTLLFTHVDPVGSKATESMKFQSLVHDRSWNFCEFILTSHAVTQPIDCRFKQLRNSEGQDLPFTEARAIREQSGDISNATAEDSVAHFQKSPP